MASRYLLDCTRVKPFFARTISTSPTRLLLQSSPSSTSPPSPNPPSATTSEELPPQPTMTTHYKITLHRSAISLGSRIKDTLTSLGIHRRFQTVYHRHTPEAAGKILKVKELVQVENVPGWMVKTKEEMTKERQAKRGYKVVGERRGVI